MSRSGIRASLIIAVIALTLGCAAGPALASVTVGTAHTVNSLALTSVSCSTSTSCEAVAPGASQPLNPDGSAPTGQAVPDHLSAVGCAAGTSTCEAAGNDGQQHGADAPIVGGMPGSAQSYPDIVSDLHGVACAPGGSACVAVGDVTLQGPAVHHPLVVPITAGVPGTGQYPPGDQQLAMNNVACPSTNCVAVGQGGAVWSLSTSGGASAPQNPTGPAIGNLWSVACPTTSNCLAVGTGGTIVPITGGTPGAVQSVPGVNTLLSVACSNATTCLAVGTSNSGLSVLVPINNGTAGTPIDITGSGPTFFIPSSIACSGASCIAVGSQGGNHGVVLPVSTGTSTTTTLSSSANPSTAGQPLTLTATVSPSSGAATPTGSVTFSDGSTTLGTGSLSGTTATFTTSSLTPGDHNITATYGGDTDFAGSTSSSLTQSVAPAPVSPAPVPPLPGAPVRRTLSVSLAGTGAGHVSGGGLSCPGQCSAQYADGTKVTLVAVPAAGSAFAGWTGACSGTASCVVTLSSDLNATARFVSLASAVSGVRLLPKAFPAAPNGPSVVSLTRPPKGKTVFGTTVSYKLSVTATIHFTVTQTQPGQRQGKGSHARCVAVRRHSHGTSVCVRTLTSGSFSVHGSAGVNRFRFTGRLHGKALRIGNYKLVITTRGQRITGRTPSIAFRITG